ncbi:22404_t:CDS:2 [Gigaspora margarita]|uniref:22404_t:CDS:1 n=1 Tax=Gigaspora margarita TaxID=4874 RepID=A0ABN7UTH8_GIGMA|nr:22404_t:CDS:2 [Gigaspora margarita]
MKFTTGETKLQQKLVLATSTRKRTKLNYLLSPQHRHQAMTKAQCERELNYLLPSQQ